MSPKKLEFWGPIVMVLVASCLLGFWLRHNPARSLVERLPGADRSEGGSSTATGTNRWEGRLVLSNGVPAKLTGVWPQFRGPRRDNINTEGLTILRAWGDKGPKRLWQIPVGEGFAAPVIWQGRVYLTDYDREIQGDALRCLSLDTGQEIWRYTYPSKVKRNHGMSRSIPAVTDKYVVSLGPKCQVICVRTETGELIWQMDLIRQFNAEVPPWYAGQCPLIDQERAILATGGDALLLAVDCSSGRVVWQSSNPANWQMTHSSIAPIEYAGRRQYVYCGSGGVAGIAAEDGQLLWQTTDWKISIATVPTPVPVGEGTIFLSGGYNAGSLMLQLKGQPGGGGVQVESVFRLKPAVFGATQQTPVFHQDHLFGVRPDGQFGCLDLSGKIRWESGADNRYGNGPFLFAGNLVFLMDDAGVLTLAEATPGGFQKLSQAKVLAGPDAWGPMALADGRLLVRDLNQLLCLEVAEPQPLAQTRP